MSATGDRPGHDEFDLTSLLSAWSLSEVAHEPLVAAAQSSLTWTVRCRQGDFVAKAVETAGSLLGRVHAILVRRTRRDWVPAALLEWSTGFAASTGNDAATAVVAELTGYVQAGLVTQSVLYGDPSPEILLPDRGEAALVDWGTPSWGPLLHDVAAWLRWLRLPTTPDRERSARFLTAYRAHMSMADEEMRLLDRFGAYGDAFGT